MSSFSSSVTVFEFQILTDWVMGRVGDRRFLKLGRDHELEPPKHGKPKKQKLEGKAGHVGLSLAPGDPNPKPSA